MELSCASPPHHTNEPGTGGDEPGTGGGADLLFCVAYDDQQEGGITSEEVIVAIQLYEKIKTKRWIDDAKKKQKLMFWMTSYVENVLTNANSKKMTARISNQK